MRVEDKLAQVLEDLAERLARLDDGLAQFHNSVRLQGARYVAVGGVDGRLMACGAPGRLLGWSLHETAGAAATIALRDARVGAGEIIATVDLAASTTQTIWLGPTGVSFTDGLYLDAVAGAFQGTVFLGTDQA